MIKSVVFPYLPSSRIMLWGLLLLFGFFLLVRNLGLYPVVFADEYFYSRFSRLVPFSEANVPDYLFYGVYQVTNQCGDGFLSCARLLNVIFYLAGLTIIYRIARRLVGPWESLFVVVLSALGPSQIYTAYFMPESLYFMGFWLLIDVLTGTFSWRRRRTWITCGVLMGLLSLVKPHVLLMIPALIIFIFFANRVWHQLPWRQLFCALVGLMIALLMTKLLVGMFFAGEEGLTLFGKHYSGFARDSAQASKSHLALVSDAMKSLSWHLTGMLFLFGLAIVHAVLSSFKLLSKPQDRNLPFGKIALLSPLLLISGMGLSAFFTAMVVGIGPYETLNRLHMRYYDFEFPLVILGFLDARRIFVPAVGIRVSIAICLGMLLAFVAWSQLNFLVLGFSDNPGLFGLFTSSWHPYLVLVVGIISLMIWIFKTELGNRLFIYGYLPVVLFLSAWGASTALLTRQNADTYDRAGLVARQILSPEDRDHVLVLGPDLGGLYRTLFYLDEKHGNFRVVQSLEDVLAAQLSTRGAVVLIKPFPGGVGGGGLDFGDFLIRKSGS